MRITIICVGKIKEKYFSQAIDEYAKRLSRYCKLDFVEVADEMTPNGCSEGEENLIKAKEGDRILKAIKDEMYVINLAINGKKYDSQGLSQYIERLGVEGKSHLAFVIGGSLGLDERVIRRGDASISFSDMTFPHQLMRVLLLEQIYRSYRIMNNEPYHK